MLCITLLRVTLDCLARQLIKKLAFFRQIISKIVSLPRLLRTLQTGYQKPEQSLCGVRVNHRRLTALLDNSNVFSDLENRSMRVHLPLIIREAVETCNPSGQWVGAAEGRICVTTPGLRAQSGGRRRDDQLPSRPGGADQQGGRHALHPRCGPGDQHIRSFCRFRFMRHRTTTMPDLQ